MADIWKTKKTIVNVEHDYRNDMHYSVSTCDSAEGEVYIEAEGKINGREIGYEIEMPLADVPFFVELLKEFC